MGARYAAQPQGPSKLVVIQGGLSLLSRSRMPSTLVPAA